MEGGKRTLEEVDNKRSNSPLVLLEKGQKEIFSAGLSAKPPCVCLQFSYEFLRTFVPIFELFTFKEEIESRRGRKRKVRMARGSRSRRTYLIRGSTGILTPALAP